MKTRNLLVFIFFIVPAISYAQVPFDYIPSTDCTPIDRDSVKKLELIDGEWRFREGYTGKVTLECPIDVLGDFVPESVGGVFVFFKDSDGADNDTNATFHLLSRQLEVVDSYGSFVSDQANTTDAFYGFVAGDVDVISEFWYVRVKLHRKSSQEQISLYGLIAID